MSSQLPMMLLQNTSTLGSSNELDLQADLAKEMTFLVTVTGNPSSFSIDLEGAQVSGAASVDHFKLATVTASGFVTVSSHWVRYLRANLTALTGGSSPTVSVSVAVPEQQ